MSVKSIRLVNEDILCEEDCMLPESGNAHKLLRERVKSPTSEEFPVKAAEKLLEKNL